MLQIVAPTQQMTLDLGQQLVIGRGHDAGLRIDHPSLSRQHLVISNIDDTWVADDPGSSNGVYCNGQRIGQFSITGPTVLHLGAPNSPIRIQLTPQPAHLNRPTIAPSGPVRIGRDAANTVVLDDLLVSRHHAEVAPAPDGALTIRDLDSHNGTFVNGVQITAATLTEGDRVTIGQSAFRWSQGALHHYDQSRNVSFSAAQITCTAGDKVLVDRVGFGLEPSTLLAIVGPSGSGKSTLLGALAGLRPASAGQVLFDGRDLYRNYADLRHRIGFVPQDDIVHAELTVEQALGYAAELRFATDVSADERAARITETLGELGLADRAGLPIHRLSGGQRKRVSVAMELLTKPSLLFLDEPTSGLDPGLERDLMELFRTLADGGRTVIVVTHATESLHLCDRVLCLAPGGKTAWFGPPELTTSYFGAAEYQTVFHSLNAHDPDQWQQHYARSEYAQRYGATTTATAAAATPLGNTVTKGWWRQLATLTRRYATVMAADRRNLALLLAGAPVLGVLMLWRLPEDQLGPLPTGQFRVLSQAPLVIFTLILGITQLGASNAVREIVKELPIFRRERSAGLSISAYLTSKVLVLSAITAAQAVILSLIALALQNGPTDAVLLGSPMLEFIAVIALTGIAAMALGLLVSALSSSADRALTILPVILVVQVVLASGGVFPEGVDKPVLKEAAYFSSAQWGFSAGASTIGLNELQAINELARQLPVIDVNELDQLGDVVLDQEATGLSFWNHTAKAWLSDIGALLAITLTCLLVAGLSLRRFDPF